MCSLVYPGAVESILFDSIPFAPYGSLKLNYTVLGLLLIPLTCNRFQRRIELKICVT